MSNNGQGIKNSKNQNLNKFLIKEKNGEGSMLGESPCAS